jgi:hypothetical protein
MPSELPRSKEALVFAWGANASALPLFPAGGETDWRIRSRTPHRHALFIADMLVNGPGALLFADFFLDAVPCLRRDVLGSVDEIRRKIFFVRACSPRG